MKFAAHFKTLRMVGVISASSVFVWVYLRTADEDGKDGEDGEAEACGPTGGGVS